MPRLIPRKWNRPREWPLRLLLNAIFYIVRSGCAWRLLPNYLPPWKTVYTQFWRWRNDGTWAALNSSIGFRRPEMQRGDLWQVTGIVGEFTTSDANAPGYRVLVRFPSDLVQLSSAAGKPATVRRAARPHPRFNPLVHD